MLSVVCFAVGLFASSGALGQCCGAPGPENPDWKQGYGPRCIFPPVDSPFAVPCRDPLPQGQAVPCRVQYRVPEQEASVLWGVGTIGTRTAFSGAVRSATGQYGQGPIVSDGFRSGYRFVRSRLTI